MITYKITVVDRNIGALLYKTVSKAKDSKAIVKEHATNDSVWVQVEKVTTKAQRYYLGFPCCASNPVTGEVTKYYWKGKEVNYSVIREITT